MKKLRLLFIWLFIVALWGCGNQEARQEAAQSYCDNTQWMLSMSGKDYVCTYQDWSSCVSRNFSEEGCSTILLNREENLWLDTNEWRLSACEDKTLFYLNWNEWDFVWGDEVEFDWSIIIDGNVLYTKIDGSAMDDVQCSVDIINDSVSVEFVKHWMLDTVTWEWIEQ